MNWMPLVCVMFWLTCGCVWLLETGRLRRAFIEMVACWLRMPRGQLVTLCVMLVWAVVHGGGKDGMQGVGQEAAEPPADELPAGDMPADELPVGELPADELPAGDMPAHELPVGELPVDDLPAGDRPTDGVLDLPPTFQMEPDSPMLLTFQGPLWPFDAFTSNAIAGMAANTYPPIPDVMLASGLALYHVATNTVLLEDTDSAPIRVWTRHGADNRSVWVAAPFPVTLGTNSYAGVGILANGRLAFGYATYHRQPTNDLPFATPYPVVTIAPLWGPFALLPSADSRVWTRTISTNRFIVCWENLLLEGDPGRPATVQCEIRCDGTIFFLYGSLADGVAAASTVGVQNLGQGWTYSHGHTNRLVAGMTVTLRPVGLDCWAEADPDGDGLSNYEEFMYGTDPLLADTDGDGPSDYWELVHGFDPGVPLLAPPDPDTDGDGVPDRWEVWLGTPTNNPAVGRQPYLDPDGDGFVSWYEEYVLGSITNSAASPLAPDVYHTDILAAITSSRPCVLRLAGDGRTNDIPWMPGISPDHIRLRLTRGKEYLAVLSRVPTNTAFTTDGFWWANLAFEAVPGGTTTTPVITNGISTYYAGTVRIKAPDRGGDYWLVPGVAAAPTNDVDAWRIEIEEVGSFCHTSTNEVVYLTDDSLFEGQIEWLGMPLGTTRTGNPLVFNPSTVTPGLYTLTARTTNNHLVTNNVQVEICNVGVVEPTIWLSADDATPYTIALSYDTYPTTGIYAWIDSWGWIYDLTFYPYWFGPGVYTVYVSHDGGCVAAQVTVNIVLVDLDVDANYDGTVSVNEPDDPIEESAGGLVGVGARDEIIIRKVAPSSWSGDVVLTKYSPKVRVFNAATGGTEIAFNGTSNRFANSALPKTLYVQGETASDTLRDATLMLTSDPGWFTDEIDYTVVKVEFADSPAFSWDDVEENALPQPVIAAYPDHVDEYCFRVLVTPNIGGDAKLQYRRNGGQVTDVAWSGTETDICFVNGELDHQIILLEGPDATPIAEATTGNVVKVRNMQDGDQFVVAFEMHLDVKGTARVVKNFSWLDDQALGQNGIHFGTELGSIPESFQNNIKNTIAYALSQATNSQQSLEREAIEVQMATVYTNPPPLLAVLDVPSARGIGKFPQDLYHLHITYTNPVSQIVQQVVSNYNQVIETAKSALGIDINTSYLTKADRDKFGQFYAVTASNLVTLLTSITNEPAIFIYHSYEGVDADYIDPLGQTWMRPGDPIRNLRTDLADNDPDLIYPGNPNNASAVYDYLNLVGEIQLCLIVYKDGRILVFDNDGGDMTRAMQLRQAFGE